MTQFKYINTHLLQLSRLPRNSSCCPAPLFGHIGVHSNRSPSMVLHPCPPSSFFSLRHSHALRCHGWLSCPNPRQLPPRGPMPQTVTSPLPLRHLLSLSPLLLPSMPPPPLALVTRSANWTLCAKRGGGLLVWKQSSSVLLFISTFAQRLPCLVQPLPPLVYNTKSPALFLVCLNSFSIKQSPQNS